MSTATYTELFQALQTCSLYLHIEWDAANAKRERSRSEAARRSAQEDADRINEIRKEINEKLRRALPVIDDIKKAS